jgi:LysM repeat protein
VGGLGLVARKRWARFIAPAVFLLAVTGVVLVVRSAVRSDSSTTPPTTRHMTTTAKGKPAPLRPPSAIVPAQYYLIQSGDTLDAIASRFGTTVDKLLALNPGTEPTTLRPDERIRIK